MAAPQRVLFSWTLPDSGATGQVMLDASINEQHEKTAQVTDHQVEKGEPVADHVRAMPQRLTIEGMVTNTPLDVPATQADGVKGSEQEQQTTIEGKTVKYKVFVFDSEFDRVREVHADLLDAIEAGAEFAITTTLKRYETFVVESFTVPRNVQTGQVLRFTIIFKHVRIVETETVQALPPKTRTKKRGAKTGKQLDEKKDEKKVATLKKLVGAIGSFFGGG